MDREMNSSWEKIDDFQSLGECDRFVAWMQRQVETGVAEEVAVASPYLGATTFTEEWFRHLSSGEVWRLVWPDAPFTGIFEQVE